MKSFFILLILILCFGSLTINSQIIYLNGPLNFSGNDAITFSDGIIDIDPSSGFSISFWLKLKGTQSKYAGLVTNATPWNPMQGFQIMLVDNCLWLELAENSDRSLLRMISTQSLNDGSWHHFVLVVNREQSRATFFIDGNKDESTVSKNVLDDLSNSEPFFIGVSRGQGGFFKGSIDRFSIFNQALNTEDIKKLSKDR